MISKTWILWIAVCLLMSLHSYSAHAKRVALVIGNSSYQQLTPLTNPTNDAQAIAKKLHGFGFELVGSQSASTPVYNVTEDTFIELIQEFRQKARGADIAFLYYAGHGAQFNGKPYLIPVDAPKPARPSQIRLLERRSLMLDDLLADIDQQANLTVAVFDACREIPALEAATRSSGLNAANYRGLMRVDNVGKNRLIAYSGASGQLVADGSGENSPYTELLVEYLDTPGLDIPQIFQQVAYEFGQQNGGQNPEVLVQGVQPNTYYLAQTTSSTDINTATQHMGNLSAEELARWQSVRACTDANALQRFVNDFPNGTFTPVAQNCLNDLTANQPIALYIDTIPSGAQVRILNITPPYQYGMTLQANRYHIEVSKAGYQSTTQWFELSKNNQTLQVRLEQSQQDTFVRANNLYQSATNAYYWENNRTSVVTDTLQQAIDAGHPYAKAELGKLYYLGNILDKNEATGRRLITESLSSLRAAAQQGDLHAMYLYGYMYNEGYGVTQDYNIAVEWYRKAAEHGSAIGQNGLGYMYLNGYGVTKDYNLALEWLSKAAEQIYASALTNMGVMYQNGYGVPQDYREAVTFYQRAAVQGLARAQYNLGVMYKNGYGVTKDYNQAVNWYRKAAEQGYANAQTNLGYMHRNGYGAAQDNNLAVHWYRQAAEQGNAIAQTNLGFMYEKGYGVSQNYYQAVSWYRKAAEQGGARAQRNLGYMYEKGLGTTQDYNQAVEWYRKAAEQGYASGQTNLAIMYEYGRGVSKDYSLAVMWYRKAAEQGYANGQAYLGDMYENGKGVIKDLSEARRWYQKAADQGNDFAQQRLNNL